MIKVLLAMSGILGYALVSHIAAVPIYGDSTANSDTASQVEIEHAIDLAGTYLERVCGSDGRFVYLTKLQSGRHSDSYNVVRHAGSIYALGVLESSQPDEQGVDCMVRASSFLRHNYIGTGVRPNQLVVWSKPLPEKSAADLGATGLGLVALTALDHVKPDSVPLVNLQALGAFLLFMQRDDGSFISKYRADRGPDDQFESLYYPGEAALGLIDLYEIDHSPVWLNAAVRALSYLAKSRVGLSDVPPDHWALIATAKLLPYYPKSDSPASREELIRHAVQICQVLMKDQVRTTANESIDGSFDPAGRTAPTATRMEGLLAALEFLPEGPFRNQVKDIVDHGIAFLLRTQIKSGIHAGAMPNAHSAASPDDFYIRIDFVQHALCAWLEYQRMFPINGSASR